MNNAGRFHKYFIEMFNIFRVNFVQLRRNYTTKAKRSILRQDVDSMPTYTFPKSTPDKNRVYGWGFHETGAIGVQTSIKKHGEPQRFVVHHPTRLKFAENCAVQNIAAGYGFTAFAVTRSDGEILFGTGLNTDCQLGLQEKRSGGGTKQLELLIYPSPISLPLIPDEKQEDLQIKCMSAGRAHLVVVTNKDTIFTLGNNYYGQCARPVVKDELYRTSGLIHRIDNLLQADDSIVAVECGQDHTLILSEKGKILSCGWGYDGQTGQSTFSSTSELKMVEGDIKDEKIVKVSSAADTVLAVNDKGEVFGWGNSEYGQFSASEDAPPQINVPRSLEITKGLGKIIDIAAGGSFCMVLNEDGDVFTWGYGILGFGPNVEQTSKPKMLLPPLFGRNEFNPSMRVESICCGVFHMGAINSDGDLFMWGKNRFGCLGLGHQKDQYFPFKAAVNAKILKVSCGVDHTMALCKPFI